MDRIAEISELARKIKATRADAYKMTDYQRKRAALSWLDMASQSLAIEEDNSIEAATANLEAAQRIIAGTHTQERMPEMTAKTQPETVTMSLADLKALIADATREAVASAPTAKPKSDNALPEPVKATVKSLSVYATMVGATRSTVVAQTAKEDLHGLIWNDRKISFGRAELAQLGNPGRVKITIEPA